MEQFKITKKSGEQVLFDEDKLRLSLVRSGADIESINKVIEELNLYVRNGMSTHKVYKKAYSILVKLSHRSAGRYRLKNAIMELGPTGYPFEKFIGALLQNLGYETKVGQIIHGKCVKHEVDVVAESDDKLIVVECKYHHEGKGKSDVKVPMYIRSRFNDIYEKWTKEGRLEGKTFEGWLVTNTRFTEDAEVFGSCTGLQLLSWDYPRSNSLKQLIDNSGLHPLTSLKTLTVKEKKSILEQGAVLCKELNKELLISSDINPRKFKKILDEAKNISDCL
jgi:hypothetical protein